MTSYLNLNNKLQSLLFAKKSNYSLAAIQKCFSNLSLKPTPYIHVAGTNGKGSVAQKMSETLRLSGYKVGRFTSPHISTFRERITINNEPISTEDVECYLPSILEMEELTFFEVSTLLALKYFSEKKVDVAVIEVGLGGRLDATNCITPLVSVITSISFDHMHILGGTLEKIASEKAGIIKPKVPVVIGPTVSQMSVEQKAKECKSKLYSVPGNYLTYDEENQAVAKKTLSLLCDRFKITDEALREGLLKKPPCRFEKIQFMQRNIILDMGHNSEGLKRVFSQVKKEYPNRSCTVFFNLSCGHDQQDILDQIQTHQDKLFILDEEHPRLQKAGDLSKRLQVQHTIIKSDQFKETLLNEDENHIFLCVGSIFFMKTIRKALGLAHEEDLFPIYDGSANFR